MTDTLKIAMVLDDSIDRPDGVQQYVLSLGAHLESLGHEVHYVCSDAERTDITVHSLARNMGVNFNGNGLRIPLPTSRKMLREFLEREQYDVIHVQTPHSPFFAARVVDEARRVQGDAVRIVGTFLILPSGRLSSASTRALGLWLRSNLRKFDAFCALTAPAADFARATFGIESSVIPSGVDVAQFADAVGNRRPERSPGDVLTVSFLGRLVDRKGVLELIRAVAALDPDVRAKVKVRIGGKGPLMDQVKQAVAAEGLDDLVSLEGFVSEADKPQFYADADIAVFPAMAGVAFGIVLIEAMASGAGMVLGGNNPGYRAVLGEGAKVTVNARSTEAFARALTELIEDADLRASIGAEQAERIKQFDIAVVGDAILELYGA